MEIFIEQEDIFMQKFTELSLDEMEKVSGGKYYGNGLYVNSNTGAIYVDWSQTFNTIANNSFANLATGGAAGWNGKGY
jgi:hypothetical protein